MNRVCLSLATLFLASLACAEKNAQIPAKLATLSAPTVQASFDGDGKVKEPLSTIRGEWKRVDGAIHGKEILAEKHAAVLHYLKPNRNSIVRFSFKFDDNTTGMHFSLNHKRGHLFRVVVLPTRLTVNLDKDKKDPKSKAMRLGESKAEFKPGQWYTMQVEMLGDRVVAQTDNGASVSVQHEKLDTDKPNYRFIMKGNSLSVDDLSIWDLK